MEAICGYVRRVVFNSDNFYIASFERLDESGKAYPVTVRGNIFGLSRIRSGISIKLLGDWTRHPKYGSQFAISSWEPWANTKDDISLFLRTCLDGFIDGDLTSRLVAAHGQDTFRLLTSDQKSIQELEGVDRTKLEHALLCWKQTLATRDAALVLSVGGFGAMEVQGAILRFGTDAASVIKSNPYRLLEVRCFTFPKVDEFARRIGIRPNDERRSEGAILWALKDSLNEGHLYLPRGDLSAEINRLFRVNQLLPTNACQDDSVMERLAERGSVVLEPGVGLYLPDYHHYERESARVIASLLTPATAQYNLSEFVSDYERANNITLSDAQREALEKLSKHRVLILSGLPGTGKSLLVKAMVRLFEKARLSFQLMAPTGIAAKRLASLTEQPASTIHRALRFDGSAWGHGPDNRLYVDAVVVDECSMVDQELIYRLLVSLRPDTTLVLVGDDAQLPSVGPGNVLRELLSCEAIPSVRLTQIFRQSEKGEIVVNAHRVNRGEVPLLQQSEDSEFRFVRVSDEEKIVNLVVEMASKLKSRNANFQVISAKYDGVVGVNNLNDKLRDRLNPPGPKEWKQGFIHFREGDRIMVVRNDYELGIYNGDVGKLLRIGKEDLVVRIFDGSSGGSEVCIPFYNAEDTLRLAYAVTTHKIQGSEFDTIIFPIVTSQGRMLQRNLFYTALTRARKKVWVLGEEAAIHKAVANNRVIRRNTTLSKAVVDALSVRCTEEESNDS